MANGISKAAAELRRRFVPPPVLTQSAIAEKLGVTAQAVSSWVTGRALPSAKRMQQLEELLGIPMRDWLEEDVVEVDPAKDIASNG